MTTIQTRISFHAQTSVHQIRPRKSQARRRMPGSSPLLMRVAPEVGRLAATPASRAGEPQRGRQLVGDLPELLSVERVPNGDVDAPEFVGAILEVEQGECATVWAMRLNRPVIGQAWLHSCLEVTGSIGTLSRWLTSCASPAGGPSVATQMNLFLWLTA